MNKTTTPATLVVRGSKRLLFLFLIYYIISIFLFKKVKGKKK